MSKFLSEKKKLIEDVYEKASSQTTETSFNGIILHLEQVLNDEFEGLSYKSFENYYKALVENDEDYNIKTSILDNLSRYLGYDTFKDYCSEWRTVEYSIQQAISKIVITIINKPILTMPEFMKKNGMGIMEMALVICLVTGSVVFSHPKNKTYGFAGMSPSMECMYWDGSEYKLVDCNDKNPKFDKKIPMDEDNLQFFKRILRKDTLTYKNAVGKTWYSKYNGEVEFFTKDGTDPDTGRELRKSTALMLQKYAFQQSDSIEVE
ncbi:hypothetical protein [Chryseobacterium limigenitum]|uniref:Uncharacterized protein n=1 Tax=Chryseobacterium limigenitum TaxID=1612149 RepID=A0A1K2IMW8_9FLAO|nr:hypothetical protein [Chryseobacterium limigenitum]SFZ93594.1 hypothetical protein SAMN05216324_105147 [Chryseobacterium limigenitum]